jgi:TIR domain
MRIFISWSYPADGDMFDNLIEVLRENGHNAYPKQLWGFFGAKGLTDTDELDEHLRDEELTIALISKPYMSDRWLREELHALQILEQKLRPNFLLPIFLEGVADSDIPEWCLVKPHVDFRGRTVEAGFKELLLRLNVLAANPRLAVFVSYSVKDDAIATALTNLLSKAFNLTPEEILCTGVEGHRLLLSVNTDEALRRKIREAKVFVCIATENSIGTRERPGSFYVAAELGARWGMKRYLAFMLAGGATGSLLRAPFSTLNALSCDDHAQVQQFIRQIGPVLGRDPQPADTYYKAIDELVNSCKTAPASS